MRLANKVIKLVNKKPCKHKNKPFGYKKDQDSNILTQDEMLQKRNTAMTEHREQQSAN